MKIMLLILFLFTLSSCGPMVMLSDYRDKDSGCSKVCANKYSQCISNEEHVGTKTDKQLYCRDPYEKCILSCN